MSRRYALSGSSSLTPIASITAMRRLLIPVATRPGTAVAPVFMTRTACRFVTVPATAPTLVPGRQIRTTAAAVLPHGIVPGTVRSITPAQVFTTARARNTILMPAFAPSLQPRPIPGCSITIQPMLARTTARHFPVHAPTMLTHAVSVPWTTVPRPPVAVPGVIAFPGSVPLLLPHVVPVRPSGFLGVPPRGDPVLQPSAPAVTGAQPAALRPRTCVLTMRSLAISPPGHRLRIPFRAIPSARTLRPVRGGVVLLPVLVPAIPRSQSPVPRLFDTIALTTTVPGGLRFRPLLCPQRGQARESRRDEPHNDDLPGIHNISPDVCLPVILLCGSLFHGSPGLLRDGHLRCRAVPILEVRCPFRFHLSSRVIDALRVKP